MIVRRLARPLLSTVFVTEGLAALRNPAGPAQAAEPVIDTIADAAESAAEALGPQVSPPPIPDDTEVFVRINAGVMVGAGLLLAAGKLPRLSCAALAATLVPTTLGGHRFWEEEDREARADQQVHFVKNVSLLGGLLLAAVDTEGRPGVGYRVRSARHQASRARRRATRDARLAARAARAGMKTQKELVDRLPG